MTAISDEATSTGAVVRKPPGTTLWGGGEDIASVDAEIAS